MRAIKATEAVDPNGLVIKLLEGLGVAQEDVLARLEALKAKYPDLEALPLSEVENVVAQFIDSNTLKMFMITAVGAFLDLLKTGKGQITRDPSALA